MGNFSPFFSERRRLPFNLSGFQQVSTGFVEDNATELIRHDNRWFPTRRNQRVAFALRSLHFFSGRLMVPRQEAWSAGVSSPL